MQRSRLPLALAVAFGAMTLTLAASGLAFNLAILAPAVLFGAVTYILWAHGTGRLAERVYRRVERRAAMGARDGRTHAGSASRASRRGRNRDSGRARGRTRATRDRVNWEGAGDRGRRRQQADARGRSSRVAIARRNARTILGVESGADQPAVKRAYRERIKEVHPDTAEGDVEQFKRVQAAYETLRE